MKVVWLCHLSNKEIQDIVHPLKNIPEFAPWIFRGIQAVEEQQCFELHIVSPHMYINHLHEFEKEGIYYHFFNPYLPLLGHPGLPIFNGLTWYEKTDFSKSKKIVSRIISKIEPDVVHLYGGENPYYSAAILPLVEIYPTILTIQGFISHTTMKKTPSVQKKIQIENRVINSVPVCFYRSKAQAKSVLEINPRITLLPCMFCSYELKYQELPTEKKYDLVFFANISIDKGIVDLLKAVSLIKKKKHDISLCIIGGSNNQQFVEMANEYGIGDNVVWKGFLPSRKDVHFLAAQCRISVLPTYHDMYPGTIIESMFLGIPMVTYDVDSNPEINEQYEAIKLVKVGDVDSLASNIYQLLIDDEQRKLIGEAGKRRAYEMFAPSNEKLCKQWINGYTKAIQVFSNRLNK